MTLLNVILIIGALATSVFILFRVRRSKVQIEDSIFWLVFSGIVFLLSIFPQMAYFFSRLLGFEAPVNFIYLVIIFILIVHQFWLTMRLSQTNNRLKEVIQRKAIDDHEILHNSKKNNDN